MRKVPELRFAGFDGEWKEKKINEFAEFYSGGTPTSNNRSYYNGSIPFIRSGEIHSNITELYISEEGLSNSSAKMVNKGDLVYALYGATSGEADIIRMSGAINQAILAIILEDEYNPIFILNYLNKSKNYILSKYLQGGQGNLSGQIVRNIDIALPKSSEQEKIGDLFKKIDDLIEIQENKVSKLEDFKKSMLQKMFPKKGELVPDFRFDGFDGEWEEKIVGDLLDYEQPTKYIVSSEEYYETGIPVLTANKSFILGYTDEKNIYNKGEVVLFDDFTQDMKYVNFPFMVKSSALKILTEKNSNLFFMFNLLSNINLINEGHKRHYISVVQNTNVVIPSLEEQAKIGQFFKNLDSQIENEEKLLESYKMMKKSLLQKMFV